MYTHHISIYLSLSLSLSIYIYIYIYNRLIGLVGSVFSNSPGELGSIPGRIIPKTLEWYLILSFLTLSNMRYVSRVRWRNPRKGVAPSSTPQYSSF